MLKAVIIGHLGADAEVKEVNGSSFAVCRVAHTDSWTGNDGTPHSATTWVDVTLRADSPVLPYLKKGTQVYVEGTISLRVYSSEKDRCHKAGLTINSRTIQLLSAQRKEETKDEQQYTGF